MSTKKSKKKKQRKSKNSIQEIQESRKGGRIALSGYTYQFLYSCYLILSAIDEKITYQLEGLEDIDQINYKDSNSLFTHIQIKYSTQKQDASFLKRVLKNFLEVYLNDREREFKLIYDFDVSKGNLYKLFNHNLDNSSHQYWKGVIQEIREENPMWEWIGFDYNDFLFKLSFENVKKDVLAIEIEKLLLSNYKIQNDNISLYANAVKIYCLESMEKGLCIQKKDLLEIILSVQDDINKEVINPAYEWIKKINLNSNPNKEIDLSYYEGKKPTFQDIVDQLPVKRLDIQNKVIGSIRNNRVTVIKASSGQGKTTLAYQAVYELQEEYSIYQLLWCNDSKELKNIVSFFEVRVKMGEKAIIVLDSLDAQLSQWNKLIQLFQDQLFNHYRIVITAREEDWYNYSGDLSNIRELNIVNIYMNEIEAKQIYYLLKAHNKLHSSITDWRSAYKKIENRKLLIEYIYLLTHGEMLSERISYQIHQLSTTSDGKVKCEILRLICFADVCGIKLLSKKVISSIKNKTSQDPSELLKSLENEYLIRIDDREKHIEGLHPVRSEHIVRRLHEFIDLEDTAIEIVNIVEPVYQAQYFSNVPKYIENKENFYNRLVKGLWNQEDLSRYVYAIQGVFSATVMQYYIDNKSIYDDSNEHGGLFLLDLELNPFTNFQEINESHHTLDELKRIVPENKNIEYLCSLRDKAPRINLYTTDIYLFSQAVFKYLKDKEAGIVITDIPSYAKIMYWLIRIDFSFNLTHNLPLDLLWDNCNHYSIETISNIMYTNWIGNNEVYLQYVKHHLEKILNYLRNSTESLEIFVDAQKNNVYIKYILLISDISKANEESVKRLDVVGKTLPIFETYYADAIKPSIHAFSIYNIYDEAHKEIPKRNLIIAYNQELNSIWSKTVLSNYESSSVFEWLEHWFNLRRSVIKLSEYVVKLIYRILGQKNYGEFPDSIVELYNDFEKELIREFRYPLEDRPFVDRIKVPEEFTKIKNDYFHTFLSFIKQLIGFLKKEDSGVRLAILNLRITLKNLEAMQALFYKICIEQSVFLDDHKLLCEHEDECLGTLINTCVYYQENEPNRYFDKFQINSWCENKLVNEISQAQEILNKLTQKYSIHFPKKYYFEEVLSYFPVILYNFDIDNQWMDLLCASVDFCELNYDYLIVLLSDNNNQLSANGIKISKRFLINFREVLNTGNENILEKTDLLFPIEVTQKILECFEGAYTIQNVNAKDLDRIFSIFELLWSISMSRKVLNREKDRIYLNMLVKKYKNKINLLLEENKETLSEEENNSIILLCKYVFEGQEFLDKEFNEIFESLFLGDSYKKFINGHTEVKND